MSKELFQKAIQEYIDFEWDDWEEYLDGYRWGEMFEIAEIYNKLKNSQNLIKTQEKEKMNVRLVNLEYPEYSSVFNGVGIKFIRQKEILLTQCQAIELEYLLKMNNKKLNKHIKTNNQQEVQSRAIKV